MGIKLWNEAIKKSFIEYCQKQNSTNLDLIASSMYQHARNYDPEWREKKAKELIKYKEKHFPEVEITAEIILKKYDDLKKNYEDMEKEFPAYNSYSKPKQKKEKKRPPWWKIKNYNRYGDPVFEFIPPKLAEHIIEKENFLFDQGDLYYYTKGIYLPNGEDRIRSLAVEILGDSYKKYMFSEILDYIKGKLKDPSIDVKLNERIDFINLKNGMLNLKTRELLPHSPNFRSTLQLSVEYISDEKCPSFDKFLSEIVNQDCIDLMWEMIGYTLHYDYNFKKAFVLLGEGNNGKSILLNIIVSLLGEKNVSNVSLQSLCEHRFSAAILVDKLANIYPDLSSKELIYPQMFQALTGDDYINVEKKHKDGFQFKNKAKLIFSCNTMPSTKVNTDAYYDRLIIIPFPNQFGEKYGTKAVRKDTLTKKMLSELPGILNKAIDGLQRLLQNGKFSIPLSVEAELSKYKKENCNVEIFLDDTCQLISQLQTKELNPNNIMEFKIAKAVLFVKYKEWCASNNYRPFGKKNFNSKIHEILFKQNEWAKSSERVWFGIRFIDTTRENALLIKEESIIDQEIDTKYEEVKNGKRLI